MGIAISGCVNTTEVARAIAAISLFNMTSYSKAGVKQLLAFLQHVVLSQLDQGRRLGTVARRRGSAKGRSR
jgi:hypothetical protein